MAVGHVPSPELRRLLRIGDTDGPSLDEGIDLFARLRTGPEEARAIEALLAREHPTCVPEPLLLAVASALVDRGEDARAERALVRASSTPGLLLRADLLARAGELPGAVALVERVLLRDIDWPGARERHTRWRACLGVGTSPPAPDPSATVAVPAPDAPFRLLRELARGGAGVVYEAEDRELGRRVALKIYHRPDRDRAQLLHEARIAVGLAGPGIVRVFDVDPQEGWVAMEHAPLGALRARLVAARDTVDDWALPLAKALARVHAAGWVHHDVKPANVLLAAAVEPLLTDFGTARRAGEPSPPGSLGYVSPERLAGRASDARDDIYGFGRIIEDALAARHVATHASPASPGAPGGDKLRWRAIAKVCTGPDDERPRDGAALVARLGGR